MRCPKTMLTRNFSIVSNMMNKLSGQPDSYDKKWVTHLFAMWLQCVLMHGLDLSIDSAGR